MDDGEQRLARAKRLGILAWVACAFAALGIIYLLERATDIEQGLMGFVVRVALLAAAYLIGQQVHNRLVERADPTGELRRRTGR